MCRNDYEEARALAWAGICLGIVSTCLGLASTAFWLHRLGWL